MTSQREYEILAKIAQSVISTGVTLEFLEEIKHTPAYEKQLKLKGNLYYKELQKEQKKHYDKLLDTAESDTDAIFNIQHDLIKRLAKLDLHRFAEVDEILEAYEKSPKSILGIAKKINR